MLILGLDPSLSCTGWGVIRTEGNRMAHVANGQIATDARSPIANRLVEIARQLDKVMAEHAPARAAVEEAFVNRNAKSSLKLGQARGVVLVSVARHGVPIAEYAPKLVKKAVTGSGRADKDQVFAMVSRLLPGTAIAGTDAADALAVAITHAHHI